MVNQQLIDWIRNQEANNFAPEQIKSYLIEHGYNPNDVNEAFNFISPKQPPQQLNSPNKKTSVLPILIIGIIIVAIIGGGIFWFTSQNGNPKELYANYIEKQKDTQTYSVVYNVNMPTLMGILGSGISMKIGIFKMDGKEKRVAEINAMGQSTTVSTYNLGSRVITCTKGSLGLSDNDQVTCGSEDSSEEMTQLTSLTDINTDKELLEVMNITYKGTDTISKIDCASFRIVINNLSQFINSTDVFTSDYFDTPSNTPMTLDVCLEKKTGIPLIMNISTISKSELSGKNVENVIMEITMESFSDVATADKFILPVKFGIKDASCDEQNLIILLDSYTDSKSQITVNILESSYLSNNKNVLKSLPIQDSLNANTPTLINEKHGQSSSSIYFEVCADTECHTSSCYNSDHCLQYSLSKSNCEQQNCLFKNDMCKGLYCYDLDTKDICNSQFKCKWSEYSVNSGYCTNKYCSDMTNANDCSMMTDCIWSNSICISEYEFKYQQSTEYSYVESNDFESDYESCNYTQTDTSDTTPRIAYWSGKVNQHTENGVWMTDPDGTSGANLDMLTYCKKWYNDTITVIPYKNETIVSFKDAWNTGCYTTIKTSYWCRNY